MKKFMTFMLTLLSVLTLGVTLHVSAATGDTYTKVTSIDSLETGDTIALYSSEKSKGANIITSSNFKPVDGKLDSNGKLLGNESLGDYLIEIDSQTKHLKLKLGDKYVIKNGDNAKLGDTSAANYDWEAFDYNGGLSLRFVDGGRFLGIHGANIKPYATINLNTYDHVQIYVKDEIVGTAYKTNFHLNDGSDRASTVTSRENTNVTIPSDPVRKGYRFDGWFDAAEGGNKLVEPLVATQNREYYAHWTAKEEFTITLVYNDGITENLVKKGNEDDSFTLDNSLTRDGYVFLGWYDSQDGGSLFEKVAFDANHTLYARWKEVPKGSVELNFNENTINNGGYVDVANLDIAGNKFTMKPGNAKPGNNPTLGTNGKSILVADLKEYGLTDKGAILEPLNNTNNVKTVEYGYHETFGEEVNWGIYFKGATENKPALINSGTIAADTKTPGSISATLDTPKNGKFILVISGPEPTSGKYAMRLVMESYKLVTENVKEPTFADMQTKSSLAITYDSETKMPVQVNLRFGGIINEALYDSTARYGVIAIAAPDETPFEGLTEMDINDFIELQVAVECTPVKVDGGYQFAWVINNMEGHFNNKFRACMFMIKDGNVTISKALEDQTSVVDVVNIYKTDESLNAYTELFDNILAKAKEELA